MSRRDSKSVITLRINEELKQNITKISLNSSLTITDVIVLFLTECINKNSIPLSLLGGSKEYFIDSTPLNDIPSDLFKNYYLIKQLIPNSKTKEIHIFVSIELKEKALELFNNISISLTLTDAITLYFVECVKQNRIILNT